MASEENPKGQADENEREHPGDGAPFQEALKDLCDDNVAYLGHPDVVDAVLRSAAVDALSGAEEPEFRAIVKNFAKEFLGKGTCKGIPGWNEPGKIDAFLRRNGFAHESDNAEQAVGSVFLSMVDDLVEIENFANQEGVLDEQWTGEVETIYCRYRLILMGVDQKMLESMLGDLMEANYRTKSNKWTKTYQSLFGRWRE